MREERLVIRVESLIEAFDFRKPFSLYLKEHFRANPQMGARDRRMTREWCYNYFRLGRILNDLSFRQRLSIGCFLCNNLTNSYLTHLLSASPFDENDLPVGLDKKMEIVRKLFPGFNLEDIFPMLPHLSAEIAGNEWLKSFLIKPRVWIRMRKEYSGEVRKELKTAAIEFVETGDPLTLSFAPDVQLEKTISFQNGFFEIQDICSQQTAKYFQPADHEKWWDACAGSGGKSLMLAELAKDIHIIATDVRSSILISYAERMRKAGFHNFQTQEFDFDPQGRMKSVNLPAFEGIIADVPCTGSGTWSRSPEWNRVDLTEKLLNHYVPLQRKIVNYVLEFLKPGKPLIFITCSVFKEENEENIHYFTQSMPLVLENFEYLKGFSTGADTLFVARFIRK